jgi:hypothetical protein
MSVIDPRHIVSGKSINYNVSDLESEAPESNTLDLSVEGNNIYLAGRLFATYYLSKKIKATGIPGTWKGNYLYDILDTNGQEIAMLRVPVFRSVIYLQPLGEKDYIEIITPERNEQKLIALAGKILAMRYAIK